MNKITKWLGVGALVLTLGACSETQPEDNQEPQVNETGPVNPLLSYEGLSEDSVINAVSDKQAIKNLESGDGILILSRPECSWCQLVMPVIDNVAKQMQLDNVYYVDTTLVDTADEKEALQTLVNGNLAVEEGEIIMYTPDVYVFKAGEVVGHQLGGVEGSSEADQVNQLTTIYSNLFSEIK